MKLYKNEEGKLVIDGIGDVIYRDDDGPVITVDTSALDLEIEITQFTIHGKSSPHNPSTELNRIKSKWFYKLGTFLKLI